MLVVGGDSSLSNHLSRSLEGLAEVTRSDQGPEPSIVVLDAQAPGAVADIADLRRRRPELILAAHLSRPDRSLWEEAERAGADLVSNRGALARALGGLLRGLGDGGTRRRRFPLFDAGEVAGRLGLIAVVDKTPVGAVAVYRYGSGLACASDQCPHAGARLSEGAYEDGTITCPAHGSQFDVLTGERRRGPADQSLRTFTVAEDEGRIWLHWV